MRAALVVGGAVLAVGAAAGWIWAGSEAETHCATNLLTGNATAPSLCATDSTLVGLMILALLAGIALAAVGLFLHRGR